MKKAQTKGYALITGATSGIGYEFARLFAAAEYDIIAVARNQERLREVADELSGEFNVNVHAIAKDLFKKEAAKEIYDEVKQHRFRVNVLINDAGQGEYGYFAETDLDRELDIIQLNVCSLVSLTKYFLKDMKSRNEGKILNVASLVAQLPMPLLSVYAASKAFVLSFTEALANELKDTNITITALQPGVTDTDFFYKAGEDIATHYQEMELADPADVAFEGYKALMEGKLKVVVGAKNKLQAVMSNIVPDKKITEKMRKGNEPAKEIRKTEPGHEPSRREREMIQMASQKYKGRDLASGTDERSGGKHAPGE